MPIKRVFDDIHQSFFVVGAAIGIVAGAILAVTMRINYFGSPLWLLLAMVFLVIVYLKPKMFLMIFAIVSGMLMMFFRVSGELAGEKYISEFYGKNIAVTGRVSGDPKTDEVGTSLKLVDLKFGGEGIETAGNIYISLGKNEEIARGDEVRLSGKMSEGFGTYTGYMYRPRIVEWKRAEPGDLVVRVRNWFADRIKSLIPENEAGLGLSYLLGMRTGLKDGLDENLRMVGLVHIVVASGAHLAILVEIARKIFGKISRFAGLMFSIMFVVFFMSMVGWTPSIMRAGIMTILTLVCWYVGRKIAPWRIILIVMAGTLMINPMFLIDLGWLLSFASYAGIMMIGPALTKYFYGNKKPGFISSLVLTTISATLMTLPITLYYYGTISLSSALANLLILPTLSYAMGLTFLTGVVAGVPLIEMIVSWCAMRMLDFHIAVVEWFGGMRQFLVEIPTYNVWVFLMYGVILIGFVIGLIWKKVIKYREVE